MKDFRCEVDADDFLTAEDDWGTEGVVVSLYSGEHKSSEVILGRKDTLRLARHLIKLAEKMDD